MPIEILSRRAGIFNPAELSLLKQVFDEACMDFPAPPGPQQAADIAHDVLSAYKSGVREKEALLDAILPAQRRGHG